MLSAVFTAIVGALIASSGWFYAGSRPDNVTSGYLVMVAGLALVGIGIAAVFSPPLRRVARWIAAAAVVAYVAQLLFAFADISVR